LDRGTIRPEHTDFANPLLRQTRWAGKLFLGGSETATHGGGYMEGALEAARRIDRSLAALRPTAARDGAPGGVGNDNMGTEAVSLNESSLERFRHWVADQTDLTFDSYRRRLNRSLSQQQTDQLTQRAILAAMEEMYSNALNFLDELPFDVQGVPVERGRSALTPEVQAPFRDFMNGMMDNVISHNRTTCALSNFPDEHHLSPEYMQTILRDIAAAWQEFSLAANGMMLSKAPPAPHGDQVRSGSL
jgi:monoamine oxidase